jgi:hypothetical protein
LGEREGTEAGGRNVCTYEQMNKEKKERKKESGAYK